ncbi:DUF3054 domain-containing protein [Natrarchaeobaculum aegyptiacum]|uniref:DUF3054 domain-containing protein n=1 Tax=Natrarchaeobaculum aegyptiacum TaxID=745377 RepID=A0A2Z2HYH9_9EURY|nr:DUF3054 domain-containing protein [Natrarchaeobaculum aegyptiacum]ARS90837.1 hypothetical protein B1756_14635 [Natrarchaeobaculum aegyptiacum]
MNATTRSAEWSGSTDPRVLTLAAVDVLVIAVLILLGQRSHGISLLSDPVASVETMIPFVAGWVVASLLAGVYAREVATSVPRAVRLSAVSWIAAANIGLLLRASDLFAGGAEWPFGLVMTGTGLVAILGWRVLYAAVVAKRL